MILSQMLRRSRNRWALSLVVLLAILSAPLMGLAGHTVSAAGETYSFVDANTIRGTGGGFGAGGVSFAKNGSGVFIANAGTASWTITNVASAAGAVTGTLNGTAFGVTAGQITIADPSGVAPGAAAAGGGANGTAVVPDKTCRDYGGDLSWILCPVVGYLDDIVSSLLDKIESLLSVDRLYGNRDGGLYKVWSVMRNFALLILVPMMLVMVMGTALDMGPFSAYTVKKAMPRMVIATMFILLSWPITTFFVDLSDAVGAGLLHFITSVGAGTADVSLNQLLGRAIGGSDAIQGGLFIGIILGGVGGVAVGALSFGIIGSLALTTALALLIGWLVLIFRQLLILALVVFAPLAILAWIFPGNDKVWNFWKTGFIGLLAVYPVIASLIAIGRVAAAVVAGL